MRAVSGVLLCLFFIGFIFFLAWYADDGQEAAAPPSPPSQETGVSPPPAEQPIGPQPAEEPNGQPPADTPVSPPPSEDVAVAPPAEETDGPAPPVVEADAGGPQLPGASAADESFFIPVPRLVGAQTGTAFTIADGVWMTARHVVDGCTRVGLVAREDETGVLAEGVIPAVNADVAVVLAPLARAPLAVELDETLRRLGDKVFMIGYPQGVPGEVAGLLLGRETMMATGRYSTREPVLVWAETARTVGLSGPLGGISGGPAFDEEGEVVGVVVAESPRRGRVYTAAPASMASALATASAAPAAAATSAGQLSEATFQADGRRLRGDLRVAKVQCVVDETPAPTPAG